jgi:hypothetical protein
LLARKLPPHALHLIGFEETHSITFMRKGVSIGLHVPILFPQYVKIFVSVIVLAIDDNDVLPSRSSISGNTNMDRADILSSARILYRSRRRKNVHCLWRCTLPTLVGPSLGFYLLFYIFVCAVFSGLSHFLQKLMFSIHIRIHNNSIANFGLNVAFALGDVSNDECSTLPLFFYIVSNIHASFAMS